MPGYNKNFELTPEDLDLIETALRETQQRLAEANLKGDNDDVEPSAVKERLRSTHELLGRLHNQKKFYRPKAGSYIGG